MMRLARLALRSARWPLVTLAILFGAASVTYGVVWMDHVRRMVLEVELHDHDTLIVFTDGITEAISETGMEYGEARLLQTVRQHSDASASGLITAIVDDVRSFAGQEQTDDLTLVVARRIS
jgi:serine phosphatase RsbU (regulator of sigma subunit)